MPEKLGHYLTTSRFTAAGSGTACWCWGTDQNNQPVFIKQFLSPVYPADDEPMANPVRKARLETCARFEQRKRRLYDAVFRADRGNLVPVQDFFRLGTQYYAVTPRVQITPLTMEEIGRLPAAQIRVLVRVLLFCMAQLEAQGVVHADLKPDNILFKKTVRNYFTAKLIDFDAGFFQDDPPDDPETITGDAIYCAPETLLFSLGKPVRLTNKLDVFAMGILMHQLLCGRMPGFDASQNDYLDEALLSGAKIDVDYSIARPYRDCILRMLALDPADRPTFAEVFLAVAGEDAPGPFRRDDPAPGGTAAPPRRVAGPRLYTPDKL